MTPDRGSEDLDAMLVADGRYIALETVGRVTGEVHRVVLGFVEGDEGCVHVAAASDDDHWARNLINTPACTVDRAGTRASAVASSLADAERASTITALILKYGTPSERLGNGPAFSLCPTMGAEPLRT